MLKTSTEVGQIIKVLRKDKNFTQDDLAKKLSVSFQAVSKWENGESYPDIQLIEEMASLFNVSLDFLLRNKAPLRSNNLLKVFQRFESEKCQVEIDDIIIINDTNIILTVKNISDKSYSLKSDNFNLIDVQGSNIQSVIENLTNYDYETVKSIYRHNIPSIIPPNSVIKVELVYNRLSSNAVLWINIPDLVSDISFSINFKCFIHSQPYSNISWLSEEIIDYYSFRIKHDRLPIQTSNYPLINDEILNMIEFPNNPDFFKKYHYIFTDDSKLLLAKINENIDIEFAKSYIKDMEILKTIFKRSMEKIQQDCENGHFPYFNIGEPLPFMDDDIIHFVIRLSLTYFQSINNWMLPYINDDFFYSNQKSFSNLPFKTLLSLFNTYLSTNIVNDLLKQSEPIDEYSTIKLLNHYSDKLNLTTKDEIILKLPVESVEALERLKPHISKEAWEIMKSNYFHNELIKLEKIKQSI